MSGISESIGGGDAVNTGVSGADPMGACADMGRKLESMRSLLKANPSTSDRVGEGEGGTEEAGSWEEEREAAEEVDEEIDEERDREDEEDAAAGGDRSVGESVVGEGEGEAAGGGDRERVKAGTAEVEEDGEPIDRDTEPRAGLATAPPSDTGAKSAE